MILVIAEKPSVAQTIAQVLGANSRKEGYLEGNGYIVSWCIGHLVSLVNAETYDAKYANWKHSDLPIFPVEWQYEPISGKNKQLAVLKKLMHNKSVTEVVCATDAGREGELIFRLVYNDAKCTKPVKRLWISSLEDSAIRDGFLNLRDGSEFDSLYDAALSRMKADWLVGINATRLFTTYHRRKLVVGRVQTPTLAMLAERNHEISSFQKEKYFNVHIKSDGIEATLEKVKKEDEAYAIAEACFGERASVSSLKKETKTIKPPKLYDLTTLQREANRYYGFTAKQTLDNAQLLYEKKLLTYPRSDSNYITMDMSESTYNVIQSVIQKIPVFKNLKLQPNMEPIVNDAKVTDHHAIIPTSQVVNADLAALTKTELKLLNLVCMRLLCATAEDHVYEDVRCEIECAGKQFTSTQKNILQDGWKSIEQKFKNSINSKVREGKASYQEIREDMVFPEVSSHVSEHFTKPPKQYTEDTLLSAMETAGKEDFDPDTEKKGLGTPATRAGIIEKLISGGYVERKGKSLVSTESGLNLVKVLPDEITSPAMTAEWENMLTKIEKSEANPNDFLHGIENMLQELIHAYPAKDMASKPKREIIGKCPRCGYPVMVGTGNYFCSNKNCAFTMWENDLFFTSKKKTLTKKMAADLLNDGFTFVQGLWSDTKRKAYDAAVWLYDTGESRVHYKLDFERKRR